MKKGQNKKKEAVNKDKASKQERNNDQNKKRLQRKNNNSVRSKIPLKIIPLGGLGEIGKNLTVYEYGEDMFIVDCGMTFPDDDMLGIDIVIPDFTYLIQNADKLRGAVITHGHEDHIGGLPYLLKSLNIPIYGTALTLGLIEAKLKEFNLPNKADLRTVKPGDTVTLGKFKVEFINVNHSIPDSCAVAIYTPVGVVVQTGDFKIDYTPIEGSVINLARFGELGSNGVLALLSDSTNAERPGCTMSERKVGESFETLFKSAEDRRIIIASFSSNIQRIQQIIDMAVKFDRKVAISGRSMINTVNIAKELGYLHIPDKLLIDIDAINRYPDEKIALITTGSQGEPMSALTRMATGEYKKVSITQNDFIIISANPIPGNEKMVNKVVNELMKLGAEVIYEKMYEVHVSGHACQDELKLMLSLVKPRYFIPVHGEYKHLKKHAGLAQGMGIKESDIFIGEIGRVIEFDGVGIKTTGIAPSGKVMVDGLGVGDVGNVVMNDRKRLSQDGLVVVAITLKKNTKEIVAGPEIVSRGFVYVKESEIMMNEVKRLAENIIEEAYGNNSAKDWVNLKTKMRDELGEYLYKATKRTPMILPIIQEIQ
ncbi:MAG: ribonuclease J [Oscillospiraceae bacterium]|nr:ribonuclease J [Oscillospiraceae bacterium]